MKKEKEKIAKLLAYKEKIENNEFQLNNTLYDRGFNNKTLSKEDILKKLTKKDRFLILAESGCIEELKAKCDSMRKLSFILSIIMNEKETTAHGYLQSYFDDLDMSSKNQNMIDKIILKYMPLK